MIEKDIEIINKLGLHARATAKLVTLASGFKSDIRLVKGGKRVDAKNMMAVLLLGAGKGTVLSLAINGEDETGAMAAIEDIFRNRFGEAE